MAAAGATGITGTITMSGAKIAGGVMTTATIVAGINAKLMNAATAKAGMTVTTIAVVGAAVTGIIIKKRNLR